MWSRQLLHRIEQPMHQFANVDVIREAKESRKIIRQYNKVAKALVEYETLWHQAWLRNVDEWKAGLQVRAWCMLLV